MTAVEVLVGKFLATVVSTAAHASEQNCILHGDLGAAFRQTLQPKYVAPGRMYMMSTYSG